MVAQLLPKLLLACFWGLREKFVSAVTPTEPVGHKNTQLLDVSLYVQGCIREVLPEAPAERLSGIFHNK